MKEREWGPMAKTLQDFIQQTQQDETKNDYFQLETERVLEVNLNGEV